MDQDEVKSQTRLPTHAPPCRQAPSIPRLSFPISTMGLVCSPCWVVLRTGDHGQSYVAQRRYLINGSYYRSIDFTGDGGGGK